MGFLLLSGGPTIPHAIGYAVPASMTAPESASVTRLPRRSRVTSSIENTESSAAPISPGYAVTLTAYNAVPEQTDENPFETASGMFSNPEIIAARSANLAGDLPFGTIIAFDGSDISSGDTCGFNIVAPHIGYRVIADSMNPRFTDRIDILFGADTNYTNATGSINAAKVLGVCQNITIRVVGHINMKHPPQTQAELAEMINGNTVAFAK